MKKLRNKPIISKHRIWTRVKPGNDTDKLIMKILKYYNSMWSNNPTYFEYKKRNTDVMNFLYDQSGGRHGIKMYGDALKHLSREPEFYD